MEYGISSEANGTIDFMVGTTGGIKHLFTASPVSNNVWHHIAGTWDGTTQKIYVDGVLSNSLANANTPASLNNTTNIGKSAAFGQYYNGLLDDMRIYNRALTQSEIQSDMNTPVAPPDTEAPTTPGTPSASNTTSTSVTLSWSASTDNVAVTGYKVFRDGTQIATAPTPSHTDSSLTPSSVHSYAVSAYDAKGNTSPESLSATVITGAGTASITIGSRVVTTAPLNVRSTGSVTGTKLGTQPVGAQGTIAGGPATANGYTWWNVNYDTGADGWSIAPYLSLLQSSLPAVGLAPSPSTLTRQLTLGDTGEDVSALQSFLAEHDHVYPEKLVTGYFGRLTANAVSAFQSLHGLPSVGRVGPMTLEKIREVMGR